MQSTGKHGKNQMAQEQNKTIVLTYTLQQLLEPFQANIPRGQNDVGDVQDLPGEGVRSGVGVPVDGGHGARTEPHVLEHLHHQFSDALFVVYPPDHLDADLRDLRELRALYADVFQDFDNPFPDRNTSVLNLNTKIL